MFAGAVIVGNIAGSTVMVRETLAMVLPHGSIAVQVSVTVPPHDGTDPNVERFELPVIKQPPANPLVYVMVLGAGNEPQATVILAGTVIVGNAAGSMVIVLDTDASGLPHGSSAVHVSVTAPPHGPGIAPKVEASEVPLIKHAPANPFV